MEDFGQSLLDTYTDERFKCKYIFREVTGKVVVNYATRLWCKMPYPGHKNGCPCFGKKDTCPPKVKVVDELYDLNKRMWFVYVEFDIENFKRRMLDIHPEWTYRKAGCVLYWQPRIVKMLSQYTLLAMRFREGTIYTTCPEAMGVDVFKTSEQVGYTLTRNPQKLVYKVAMIGYPKGGSNE